MGQTELFNLRIVTGLGDRKPVKLHLKIDLVSHPALVKWLVNIYTGIAQTIRELEEENINGQKEIEKNQIFSS